MNRLLLTAVLLSLALPASAQVPPPPAAPAAPPQIDRLEITDYGVYTMDEKIISTNADGVTKRDSTNIRLAEQTLTVKAQLGVHFGFRYNVIGSPADAPVDLRIVLVYPPGGLHNPDVPHPIYGAEFPSHRKIGEQSVYAGITFGHEWGLVPGPWSVELWQGDRKLASQTFTVVM
jgi:hypothetical protein